MSRSTPAWRQHYTTTILEEIAVAENVSVLDLPPLYDVIEPDSLNRLLEHGTDVSVNFSYFGYCVSIENGDVTIAPKIEQFLAQSD